MITKVICPTDFSPPANNAVEYAAKLCSVFKTELQLLHVESFSPGPLLGGGILLDEKVRADTHALERLKFEVIDTFGISCSYELEAGRVNLADSIRKHATAETLVVIGTGGVNDMYKYFFGSNSYPVVKKVECPVLTVPEGTLFTGLKKIVFGLDYSEKSKLLFRQLDFFSSRFDSEITFLHVSEEYVRTYKNKSESPTAYFRSEADYIRSQLNSRPNLKFKQVFSEDIEGSIDDYMHKSASDLLIITLHNQSFLDPILGHPLAKELTETAGYPILVFHE